MILQGPRKRPEGSCEKHISKIRRVWLIQIRILREMTQNIESKRRLKYAKNGLRKE